MTEAMLHRCRRKTPNVTIFARGDANCAKQEQVPACPIVGSKF